ncbi:MBL fold metallo-hydrolase [Glycomyces artemisiae]|uniref:L-ascorbate metabolism protein UlaG (Beta-lactamase superfamily) n=1 Tax=Glycomyces artemisiae TaxID=1076443 RepID=A0A2T0UHJ3_9ACTN|nr:MBL fold metallo-hydrolase [Glycomyces artemisiae]PRY57405.1 L-ascorbate metabolism protein UlaG (beta-lactamase superfamily) [Glycomyces artemisiae]
MRLTKFGHSCVRLDTGQGFIVIDPGAYSDPAALDGADAVFITHEHADHVDEARLRDFHAARPDVPVFGPEALAATLGDLTFTCVSPGDAIPVAGTEVKVFGGRHAVIHPDLPLVANVCYLVDGVYHPGDSLTVPDMPVRTLLVPVAAPWLKLSEAIDFARAVDAPAVHPIHDAILSDIGLGLPDRLFPLLVGGSYRRIANGETATV